MATEEVWESPVLQGSAEILVSDSNEKVFLSQNTHAHADVNELISNSEL